MTDIAKTLRVKLEEVATIEAPALVSEQISADGTRKWALEVSGGNKIETVLFLKMVRNALCFISGWLCFGMSVLFNCKARV